MGEVRLDGPTTAVIGAVVTAIVTALSWVFRLLMGAMTDARAREQSLNDRLLNTMDARLDDHARRLDALERVR